MATVTKPIALDETFNTTEVTPRNTADVLAQELSAIATAIGNQQSAGHIVENPSGGIMPQRDGLQFVDSHLNDDSANNRTQVQTLKPVNSAAFETETEDGFYFITDEDEQPLTADDIPYDSNTSVGDRVDELLTAKVHKLTLTKTTDANGRCYLQEVPSDAYGVTVRCEGTSFYTTLPPYKVSIGGGNYYFMTRVLNDVGLTAVASTEVNLVVSYFQ